MMKMLFVVLLMWTQATFGGMTYVKGPDNRCGELFGKYEMANEKYVAIQYNSQSYGMFNENMVKFFDSRDECITSNALEKETEDGNND